MGKQLENKVCVVTGAARSIGLAIAEMYCKHGAKVAMLDILPEVIEQAKRLTGDGYPVKGYTCDITDQEKVMECFKSIEADLGNIYTLVNTAGAVDQQSIEEITPEHLNRMMNINVNGTVYCSQGALKSMKKLDNGRIINLQSGVG